MDSPIGLFDTIFFKHIYFYQRSIACHVLKPNFRPDLLTLFFFMVNISFVVFNIYTLVAFDTDTRLKCLVTFGLGLQGLVKFPAVCLNPVTIYGMVTALRNIYESNQLPQRATYGILLRGARIMSMVIRFGCLIILAATLLYVPECILESLQAGHRVPMVYMMVPGVDILGEGKWANYTAVTVYYLVCIFLAGMGTCAADMLIVMLSLHMLSLAGIFEHLIMDLNSALRQTAMMADHNDHRHHLQNSEVPRFFRNILLIHKQTSEHLATVSKMFCRVFFVEIYSDSLSLCVLIVCAIQMQWIATYPMFLMFVGKLFAYCFLGTIAELATERIYEALMNCEWYHLPALEKHKFLLMLLSAQKPTVLMAGPVPLNLYTFVSMLKTVYSAGMILIKSIE